MTNRREIATSDSSPSTLPHVPNAFAAMNTRFTALRLFGRIVDSLVQAIIMPFIGALGGDNLRPFGIQKRIGQAGIGALNVAPLRYLGGAELRGLDDRYLRRHTQLSPP